jgi:CHAT domain-containing protein/Tfp pilus assembly protein PilF
MQYQAGKLDEMAETLGKILAVEREALGELHEDVVRTLCVLGGLQEQRGDLASARKALLQAIAVGERQPNLEDWKIGDIRRALADLDRRAAWTPTQQQRAGESDRLVQLSEPSYERGRYAEGIGFSRRAMEIRGELLGKDHPAYAESLRLLAVGYREVGDYARAEPMFLEALTITRKSLGASHPEHAKPLAELGNLYWATGDYARAEPMLREAAAIRSRAMDAPSLEFAQSLYFLGLLHRDMGDYASAEPALSLAAKCAGTALGAQDRRYAVFLGTLADLYRDVGDYARAEPMYFEALAITRNALGADDPHYGMWLNSLGQLYVDSGDPARAEPMLREAMEIQKKAVGADHPEYAKSLQSLALLYHTTGDYARAEAMYLEALNIRKKAKHPARGANSNNLALLYRDMGEYARAEQLTREAAQAIKTAWGVGHPYYARCLCNLALVYLASGDSARAGPPLREALSILFKFTQGTSSFLGERQRLALNDGYRIALDGYLSVSRSAGASPADLYDHVLGWKGATRSGGAEDRLARDVPRLAYRVAELAQARVQLANLAFRPPAAGQVETWRRQLDTLRERKEALEAGLARSREDYRAELEAGRLGVDAMAAAVHADSTLVEVLRLRELEKGLAANLTRLRAMYRSDLEAGRLGVDAVAAALHGDTALVEFFAYVHFSPPKNGKGRLEKEPRLLAFVLRRGRPVAMVSLGDAHTVVESAQSWRRALDDRNGSALQAAAAELRQRVWEPLRPHLGDARVVLIAPDGGLSFLPLAALPGSKPGSFLIEDLAIGYTASGRHAVEALTSSGGPAGRGLLAVGDIDFRADPGQPGPSARPATFIPLITQRGGFQPLPGTGPEARLARDLFRGAFANQPAELLTRAEPTEAAIKRKLDGGHWRVVHLGTHGFFESPARIAALRAAARREGPFAMSLKAIKPGEDDSDFALAPLVRSGVVLAGGGREPDAGLSDLTRRAPTREDGILTAEEAQSLDLRGTELVVLSACETGLGEGRYGQGVMGLQRAVHAAGARAVVASLWKVDDAATSVLMEQFYTNLWVKKMPKLEALRQAQITVLKNPGLVRARQAELAKRGIGEKAEKLPQGGKVSAPGADGQRSNPSLWAAFVMSGDWR